MLDGTVVPKVGFLAMERCQVEVMVFGMKPLMGLTKGMEGRTGRTPKTEEGQN